MAEKKAKKPRLKRLAQTAETAAPPARKFDLYAFVAGAALKAGGPFPLECNCGGVVTVLPPFQDEYVVCARCESSIRMLVLEGDPGYVIGADSDGTPRLLPIQGSAKPHPSKMPAAERERILAEVRAQLRMKEI